MILNECKCWLCSGTSANLGLQQEANFPMSSASKSALAFAGRGLPIIQTAPHGHNWCTKSRISALGRQLNCPGVDMEGTRFETVCVLGLHLQSNNPYCDTVVIHELRSQQFTTGPGTSRVEDTVLSLFTSYFTIDRQQ